ncbi:MAG: hypothetical protein M0Q12_11620, partial [Synergistaceae bacterium]|nr:hypothetical protein [Synergistaceae bacterium]
MNPYPTNPFSEPSPYFHLPQACARFPPAPLPVRAPLRSALNRGINPTLLRSAPLINPKGNGQVPLCIPTVRVPVTPWLPWFSQPPEHSAAPLRLPLPTHTALKP